ncbi:hypothetical protein, partial [Xanthomonas campestris]|uniref:hypothetical protein n=1 Tax=Xanthomonas campestris TaxID=339 RepID=UPI001C85BB68
QVAGAGHDLSAPVNRRRRLSGSELVLLARSNERAPQGAFFMSCSFIAGNQAARCRRKKKPRIARLVAGLR